MAKMNVTVKYPIEMSQLILWVVSAGFPPNNISEFHVNIRLLPFVGSTNTAVARAL